MVFLLRTFFLRVGGLSVIAASLIGALILLFSGGTTFSCLFLLSLIMGILSFELSLGIWTMGVDDSATLRGGVDTKERSIELTVVGGTSKDSKMLPGCWTEGFSICCEIPGVC